MGTLEAWAKGGLKEVILPSGLKIRGKLPMTQDMVLTNTVDATLVSAVAALGDDPGAYGAEERATWVQWQRAQAAAYVREVWDPVRGVWEPAVVTADMLSNGVPPEDTDALEDIVLRRRTPDQVSAMSRFQAGEISMDELQRIVQEEASGTIAAWSSFRRIGVGAPDRKDGADVAPAAKPADRPSRPVRRARARRSPGGAPEPGAIASPGS